MNEPTTTLQSPAREVPVFSISRVWTLAISTLTQLVRMKTFYFLFAFAVLLLAVGNFNFASSPAQALSTVKKVSFGAMDLFAWLFAIVATALLIPRDIEDRTLYTILSKPVRRIEYLLGKLCGVLIVIGISLSVMFVVCAGMIQWKELGYIADEIGDTTPEQLTEDTRQAILLIQKNGFHPELAIAALASFMKAAVVASVTILLSTFASSSLFTIIVSVLVFLVGHAHTMATNFWLAETDNSIVTQTLLKLFKIIIPNFQIFSFSEGIVQGAAVAPSAIWQMGGLTGAYLVVFMLLSLLTFVDKEF
ncbi:MAG: ABC transporter permease subunit [Verrucomicrobiales bacterium]|nr:ABC transporter permease subunit [Verrucomicrobiales bacterium]